MVESSTLPWPVPGCPRRFCEVSTLHPENWAMHVEFTFFEWITLLNSTCIAQFSRWRVETSQERRRHLETGRGRVGLSTVPPEGLITQGLITQKREFDVHSHSFQNAGLKLHCYVSDFPRQVVQRLTILPSSGGVRNKGLTTQKTWIRPAFTQFPRSRVEISQERRGLHDKGRVWVDDSTVPP